ncbi:MAG: acyl carrier protein [Schleiferiaceae bacterium]|nr:acyl carrier protein [Schleiferiaceae bacterium]
MNKRLKEILEEISDEIIANPSSISDLSELEVWDSLFRVQLIVYLEDEVGRGLTDNEIESISDVASLKKIIG